MRRMILFLIMLLMSGVWLEMAEAGIRGHRSHARARVANRSVHRNVHRNINRNVHRNINRNVHRHIDRDFDIDIDRPWLRPIGWAIDDDPDWGWGSFAAGAAIKAAVDDDDDDNDVVVVTAPPIGTVVGRLPPSCSRVSSEGKTLYRCDHVYYRPVYQGSNLVYQVVRYR